MKSFQKILAIATFAIVLFTGCDKDDDNDNDPVNATNKELLAAKTWQVGETWQNLSGTRTHYLKGGENTSGVNMGALRLKFNTDGSGSHTDVNGTNYTFTWAFSSADETTLHIIMEGNLIFDWYFVDIESDAILQSTNVSANGLVTAKWIPAP